MKSKDNMYEIYYLHQELGKIVKAIVRGKAEAVKQLNKFNNDRDGRLYFMSPYKEGK